MPLLLPLLIAGSLTVQSPPFPRDVQIQVDTLVRTGQPAQALDLALPALARSPADPVLLVSVAIAYGRLDSVQAGMRTLTALVDSTLYPGHALLAKGVLLSVREDRRRGFELLEQAAVLLREAGDAPALLTALVEVGQLAMRLREPDRAEASLEEAEALGTPGGFVQMRIEALDLLGQHRSRTGDLGGASERMEAAMDLARRCGSILEARVANNLGWIRQRQGRYAEARTLYLQAAELARAEGNDWVQMQRLDRAASMSLRLGELDAALEQAATAWELSLRFPEAVPQQADILTTLVRARRMAGQFPEALVLADRAVALLDTTNADPDDLLLALQAKANVLVDMGRLLDALAVHEEATRLAERTSPSMQAAVHNNLGNCLLALGDPREGLRRYRLALEIAEEQTLTSRRPTYLANIASTYAGLGRYQEAIQNFLAARDAFLANGDHVNSLHVQMDLATLHLRLGDPDEAEALFRSTIESMASGGIGYRRAGCHRGLAAVYRKRGEPGRALEQLALALQSARDSGAEAEELSALLLLSRLEREAGENPERALALADTGLVRARDLGQHPLAVRFRIERGCALRALGDPVAAVTDLEAALAEASDDLFPETLYRAGLELGRCHAEAGRIEAARAAYGEAVRAAEDLRRGVGADEERWKVFASHAEAHLELASILVTTETAARDVPEAFALVEMGRARSLLDRLREQGVDLDRGVSPDLVRRREEILRRYAYTRSRMESLLASPTASASIDSLRGVLAALNRDYTRVEGRIRLERGYFPDPGTAAAGVDSVASSLPVGTVLLEVAAIPDGTLLAFHLSAGSPVEAFQVDPRALGRVEDLRRWLAVSSPAGFDIAMFTTAAHGLYLDLVQPVLARHPEARTLLFVADGPLHGIPLESLLTEPVAAASLEELDELPYLFRRVGVYYAPSATARSSRPIDAAAGPARPTLVLADPDCGPAGDRWPALPHATREATAIREVIGDRNVSVYLGAEASEARLKTALPGGFGTVHLAAHSVIDEVFPLTTAILLAPGEVSEDGLLTVREIHDLEVGADLVVLSACRTATGPQVRGEGVIALGRPFLAAGAGAVLATCWAVNDRSTAAFMEAFHRERTGPVSDVAALSRAREALLTSGRPAWHLPYHWAPFVLIGDVP